MQEKRRSVETRDVFWSRFFICRTELSKSLENVESVKEVRLVTYHLKYYFLQEAGNFKMILQRFKLTANMIPSGRREEPLRNLTYDFYFKALRYSSRVQAESKIRNFRLPTMLTIHHWIVT
jgi:hypothetical protein